MENLTVDKLLPDLAPEITSGDTASDSENVPAVAENIQEIIPIDSSISSSVETTPPANSFAGNPIGGDFLPWALKSSEDFLNFADLPPLQTVDNLRGVKEHEIRDRVQIANSVLVLLANYGSKTDNELLVKACEDYAVKMQTIIKRLCL